MISEIQQYDDHFLAFHAGVAFLIGLLTIAEVESEQMKQGPDGAGDSEAVVSVGR